MDRRNFLQGLIAAAGVVLETPTIVSGEFESREDGLYVPTNGEPLVLATNLPVRLMDEPPADELTLMVESVSGYAQAVTSFSDQWLAPPMRVEVRLVSHAAGATFNWRALHPGAWVRLLPANADGQRRGA